jgi:hypothetical protein
VELPVSLLPGKAKEQVSIKIIPTTNQREGHALLTSLSLWKNYAESVSATRLNPLQFSVSENDEALIIGYPLPSLPGKEFWMIDNILLPCGYEFELAVMPEFIKEKMNPDGTDMLVFDEQGKWQKISKSFFVPAKRSAIRLTQTGLNRFPV